MKSRFFTPETSDQNEEELFSVLVASYTISTLFFKQEVKQNYRNLSAKKNQTPRF